MICPNCRSNKFKGFGDVEYVTGDGLTCINCGWKKEEYIPNIEKKICHPKDIEYYYDYPAPLHEKRNCRINISKVHSLHIFM